VTLVSRTGPFLSVQFGALESHLWFCYCASCMDVEAVPGPERTSNADDPCPLL
jgi:hypothetical protein